ncbi:MAG: hypothetical protein JXR37_25340 [Kiritimatiellae bacterium]|nr:hypothetical protein [Kiritimatiellia bacterium]
MTDDLDSLEEELRQLVPRALSPQAHDRIRRELEAGDAAPARGRRLRWALTGLAAAAVVLIMIAGAARLRNTRREPGQTAARETVPAPEKRPAPLTLPADVFEPVEFSTVLVNEHDEGTVLVPDFGPARRVRYEFVNRVQWQNTNRNARFIVTTPQEEVVLIPVSMH